MTSGRVLFVRASAFGDVLLVNPFLRALPPGVDADLCTLHEGVDWPGGGRVHPLKTRSLASLLKAGYDRVYWFSYEHVRALHIQDGYALSTGLEVRDRVPTWSVTGPEAAARDRVLAGLPRPLVGFHPASPLREKALPLETIQAVVHGITRAVGGTVVVTGERPLNLAGCLDLSGRTRSLRELGALLSGMDAAVTIDSGPFHLAQALGLPTVGLFGCTLPELIATRPEKLRTVRRAELDCLGCYHEVDAGQEALRGCRRGDLACTARVEAREVVDALRLALEGVPDEALLERVRAYETARPGLLEALRPGAEAYREDYRQRMLELDRRLGGFKRFRRQVRALWSQRVSAAK
jgi:ADP-heptose:LPS heptosyltransferase